MKKIFLIPLLTLFSCVMAWADNIAQITIGEAEPVGYETLSDLQTAIAALPTNGTVATIKLLDDINAGEVQGVVDNAQRVISILANQHVVLDLNGKTLSATLKTTQAQRHFAQIIGVNGNGNLTITDSSEGDAGTIENLSAPSQAYGCTEAIRLEANSTLHFEKGNLLTHAGNCINSQGTLIVEDGVTIKNEVDASVKHSTAYSNYFCAICLGSGQATFNGGTVIATHDEAIYVNASAELLINNGTFLFEPRRQGQSDYAYNNALVGVSEDNLLIFEGLFSFEPESKWVDNDYVVTQISENRWQAVISENPATPYTVYTASELVQKLALDEKTKITIDADIVLDQTVTLKHTSKLNINAGHTLTIAENGLFINEGRVVNNGTIATVNAGYFSRPSAVKGTGSFTGYLNSVNVEGNTVNYTISNAMQLQFISYLVAKGLYEGKTWNIELTTDINMPANVPFDPIGNDGKFRYLISNDNNASNNHVINGNNHVIRNLYIKSESGTAALVKRYQGTIKDLKFENARGEFTDGGAILATRLYSESIIKNVSIQGSITIEDQTYGSAVFDAASTSYATSETGADYAAMTDANTDYIWFVNCKSDVNVSAPNGYNVGTFIGSISGAKGTIGFYNCETNGTISAKGNVGHLIGHGHGAGNAKYDIIALSANATLSQTSGGISKCGKIIVGASGGTVVAYKDAENNDITCDVMDPDKYTAVWNGTKYVPVEAGTLNNEYTDPQYTDWGTAQTWTADDNATNVVPNESDNVTVSKDVEVNNGTDAVANSVSVAAGNELTIKDGATLTIGEDGLQIAAGATVTVEEGATLVVGKDGINIAVGGKLIVETGDGVTLGGTTAVVLVDPEAEGDAAQPMAEISFTPDAFKVGEDAYQYRYFGIPLDLEGADFSDANWTRTLVDPNDAGDVSTIVKLWNATGDQWQDWTSISQLKPFQGYAITNNSYHGVTYTFKGKLVGNGNGTMQFKNGYNMFANSYTAPINIKTLLNGLSDNVRATIYMFVGKKLKSVSKLDFNGFRTPAFEVIPSMQGFFVLMDDGTEHNESVDYRTAVYNNTLDPQPLYAPARQETPDFNRVRINIAAENGTNDEVYLIEAADYSNDFENGFDEAKFMNNGLNIYATTAYGRQSTKISNDLNGTFIGVQGNGTYTLSFDELVGEEYQIRDLQNGVVIAMTEDNAYTFTANGAEEARFVVEKIRKIATGMDNIEEANLFVSNNTLYVGANNADIQIFAANGQLVLAEKAKATVDLSGLAAGVYTVRVANQTLKFVK